MENTPPPASLSLLLVEDDSMVCRAIGRMISKEFPGVRVYTAENGLVGLELFKEHTPEIVVTDINMPVMDGIEMATEMKKLKNDIRFIVITGYSDRSHVERFGEIGYEEYMVKPVDFEKLFAAIERCRTLSGC